MRVGVDCRKAADYGIGTHVRNLVLHMVSLGRGTDWVLFHRSGQEHLLPGGAGVTLVPEDAAGYGLRELRALSARAREHGVDLFHSPHYVLPFGLPCPAVVTVHDVIHLLDPSYRGLRRAYARFMIGRAVRTADRVITVSQHSAREISRFFRGAGPKIAVIPNGVEERFHPRPPEQAAGWAEAALGVKGPFLLFVGNPKGHKNLALLLEGFSRLARRYPRLELVVAGGDDRQRREVGRRARELGVAARARLVGPVDQEALARLYCAATVFVFPSRLEGFGLPPLEAMACGTPVAASSSSSLPEVLGPAAVYFSPESVDSLVAAVCGLLDDAAARERIARLGLERAGFFRWETSAASTLALYRQVLER